MTNTRVITLVILCCLPLTAGCTTLPGLNIFGTGGALASPADNAAYRQRRGAVEIIVKSDLNSVLSDIATGGGPTLTRAFDTAGVPAQDRPARIIQLEGDRGLYEVNPGALVTALMLYGS